MPTYSISSQTRVFMIFSCGRLTSTYLYLGSVIACLSVEKNVFGASTGTNRQEDVRLRSFENLPILSIWENAFTQANRTRSNIKGGFPDW